ncbi:hypothetical protein, partial [Pseudomonas graminis]
AVLAVRPGSLCFLSAAECRLNVKTQANTQTENNSGRVGADLFFRSARDVEQGADQALRGDRKR